MPTDHLPLADAGPTVGDAMLLEPRTTPARTPLGAARAMFSNPRVHLLLVVDEDGRFAGTVTRGELPEHDDGTVGDVAARGAPRIGPEEPIARAVEVLDGTGASRLPVVDDDGRLCGLVCWDRAGARFCVDAGRVASG